MKMKKAKYSIATRTGHRREVEGYTFELNGIQFGVDKRKALYPAYARGSHWVATEITTGRTVGAGTSKTRKGAIKNLEERFEQMLRRETLEEAVYRIRESVRICGPVSELPLEGGEA